MYPTDQELPLILLPFSLTEIVREADVFNESAESFPLLDDSNCNVSRLHLKDAEIRGEDERALRLSIISARMNSEPLQV